MSLSKFSEHWLSERVTRSEYPLYPNPHVQAALVLDDKISELQRLALDYRRLAAQDVPDDLIRAGDVIVERRNRFKVISRKGRTFRVKTYGQIWVEAEPVRADGTRKDVRYHNENFDLLRVSEVLRDGKPFNVRARLRELYVDNEEYHNSVRSTEK